MLIGHNIKTTSQILCWSPKQLWPIWAWTQDLFGSVLVSATGTLDADRFGYVGCWVGPRLIESVPTLTKGKE